MAEIVTYNFPDHKRGDTFAGKQFTITVNGQPCNLTGAKILCQLKRNKDGAAEYEFTELAGITITNIVGGVFEIDKIERFNPHPGTLYYDIELELPFYGIVRTWIEGTWLIVNDTSRIDG